MEYPLDAVCVGILVADLFTPPLDHLPGPGEVIIVDDLPLRTGGCAANAAVALAKLGAKVAVIGKVGADALGRFVRDDLASAGVDVAGIRVSPGVPTSRSVIMPVVGEDRRFVHAVGANADLRLEDIDLGIVGAARALYVGGYLLLPGLDQRALASLLRFAKQQGMATVLDVAGNGEGQDLSMVAEALPYADAFLPNGFEASFLTGEHDPRAAAHRLVAAGAANAVVTLGAAGAVACTREESLLVGPLTVSVVDPTGAGDAFDAGFVWGLLKGWDLQGILAFASALGASATTKVGCTAGVFTEEEALAFLRRQRPTIEAT